MHFSCDFCCFFLIATYLVVISFLICALLLSVAMTPSITSRKMHKFEVQKGNYNRTLIISLKKQKNTFDWRNHMFIAVVWLLLFVLCFVLSDVRRTDSPHVHVSANEPIYLCLGVFKFFFHSMCHSFNLYSFVTHITICCYTCWTWYFISCVSVFFLLLFCGVSRQNKNLNIIFGLN